MDSWADMTGLSFTCPFLQQEESTVAKRARPSPQQPGLLGVHHHGRGEHLRVKSEESGILAEARNEGLFL